MPLARRVRAFRHHIGRRGAALLCFGTLDVIYAISLAFPGPNGRGAAPRWYGSILPLWVWAIWWLVVAVVCTIGAFRPCDRAGFAAAIGIKIWWGTLGLVGWVLGEVPVSTAGIWLGLAVLVALIAGWPEAEHHVIDGEAADGGD
jgi:hypothetical protein